MADQHLKDRNGRLLGTIKMLPNGRQEIRDRAGLFKGSYESRTDETKDRTGRLLGKGNQLTTLL